MPVITPDDIDFSAYEHETEARQRVRPASLYVQALIDRVDSPQKEKRCFMPWGKTHRLIHFREGEVTVWGGQNGSGKSLVTGQVGISLAAQGEKIAVASFEMKPIKTMHRMGRQWTQQDIEDPELLANPVERRAMRDLYEQFRDWTDTRLWLYDQQGTVHWKQVCAVARYCAKELGINHLFIDNLMKCVAGEDDYNGQKAFIDEVCAIARDHSIHIHVVHHVKKPAKEDDFPTKYDFKGTGAITDQVDNVIAVWRNKKKERARGAERALLDAKPDAMLIVDKQRNGSGWEGNIGLWYLHQSQQYVGSSRAEAISFLSDSSSDGIFGGDEDA
jgi:twinkle protein